MSSNLEIIRQNLAYKEKLFNKIPQDYRGAVGTIFCVRLRQTGGDTEKAFELIRANGEQNGNSGAWEYINNLSDRLIKGGLLYYACYERLTPEEKKRLKQGYFYPSLPQPPSSNSNQGEWQKWYTEITQIQQDRNYKKGWIYHQLVENEAPQFLRQMYQQK